MIKIGDFVKCDDIFGYVISVDDSILIIDEDKKVHKIKGITNVEVIHHTIAPLGVIAAMIENERNKYNKKEV